MSIARGFVESTPEQAREMINRLREHFQMTAKERALLHRLASDPNMKDVWTRLQGKEDRSVDVICRVFDAARLANSRRPPYPKRNKVAQQKWLLEHLPSSTLENVATSALLLRENMIATRSLALSIFPELKLDELLEKVHCIERVYKEADERRAEYLNDFQYSKSRRVTAKDAPQVAFSKSMSNYFKKQFGQPLDAVVAALTQVVFNLKEGVSEETIRKRRR
jgi:hypothetical protein